MKSTATSPIKKTTTPKTKKNVVKEPPALYATTTRTLQFLGGRSSVLAGIKILEENDFIDVIKK